MSGLTPELLRVKVEGGGGAQGSPGHAPRHRALPPSFKGEEYDEDEGINADIDRLLVLDALVKSLEKDIRPLIESVKKHMIDTNVKCIQTRNGPVDIREQCQPLRDDSPLSAASHARAHALEAQIAVLQNEVNLTLRNEHAMEMAVSSRALWKHSSETVEQIAVGKTRKWNRDEL